jgi:hypothetical protein
MNKYYDNSTFFRGKLVLEKLRRKNFIRSKSFVRIKSNENDNDSTTTTVASDSADMNYTKDQASYTSLALACKNTFYPPSLQQLTSPSQTKLSKTVVKSNDATVATSTTTSFTNRTQNSIKADRRFTEYFYHCITNIDYPMRVNYCWNFSSNHEKFFKTTVAKRKLERKKSMMTSKGEGVEEKGDNVSSKGECRNFSSSLLDCVGEKIVSLSSVAKATKKNRKRESPKLAMSKTTKTKKIFRANSHLSSIKVKRIHFVSKKLKT